MAAPSRPKALPISEIDVAKHTQNSLIGSRVLIVDDIEMNAWIAASVLEHHGAICECSCSAIAALERLQKGKKSSVDLVLLDIHMPEMNGFEVAVRIRQTEGLHDLPLIAYTTAVYGDTESGAKNAGIDAVIYKPVEPELLVETCRKYLTRSDCSVRA
ncbi:MAG TPA: response regulator [Limnobacter sp.]|nr:response regulator [Limnobacter sp.]